VASILICKRCKFGEKICYGARDIEFFPGDYFFWRALYIHFNGANKSFGIFGGKSLLGPTVLWKLQISNGDAEVALCHGISTFPRNHAEFNWYSLPLPSDLLPSTSESTFWFWRVINLLTYLLTYLINEQWLMRNLLKVVSTFDPRQLPVLSKQHATSK